MSIITLTTDYLEISVSGGNAFQALQAKVGDEVWLKVKGHEDRREDIPG